jgi:hypothetical protein
MFDQLDWGRCLPRIGDCDALDAQIYRIDCPGTAA